ncbi:MAG: hypothetical protein AAB500_02150 [Patescibacteria group bacterium]
MSEGPPKNPRDRILHEKELARHGVIRDPFNDWAAVLMFARPGSDSGLLAAIPTYEASVRAHPLFAPHADFILEASDPEKVRKYNELAAIYNQELPAIKRSKDYKRANELAHEAMALIKL